MTNYSEKIDEILDIVGFEPYMKTMGIVKRQFLELLQDAQNDYMKRGFYAGQAMAGVELYDCHDNWKKWNVKDDKQDGGQP